MSDRAPRGSEAEAPPRLWERLLGSVVPKSQREAALGDAAEEFARRMRADGPAAARRWYRWQALSSVLPGAIHALGMGGGRTGGERMWTWLTDLKLAARSMARRPGFAATVVVTLALGVGANTALFGVFRTVFLEPIPLPDPHELVAVMEAGGYGCCGPASVPDYVDWRERNRSFTGLAMLSPGSFAIAGVDEPSRVYGTYVTASAFEFLRVQPALGRSLRPEDELTGDVVLLSDRLWCSIGAPPDIVGSAFVVDGKARTVVGVMPAGFDVPSPWSYPLAHQLYMPFPPEWRDHDRRNHSYPVIARLAPGVTKAAAQEDMDRIMAELAVEQADTHRDRLSRVFTVHEYLYGDVGKKLGLLLGAAGLVLLVACGNVAGLLLARAAGRETELAVRSALGAGRRALVRLLFSEALLLALVGGVAGVMVSFLAVDALRAVLPASVPRVDEIRIDGVALAFALAASLFTALAFGVVPAVASARGDLASAVREAGVRSTSRVKERMRDAFIVGQIALGLVLVNGAVLLVRSYLTLRNESYGFSAENVVTLAVNPAGARYAENAAVRDYYERVAERVRAVPGVVSAGSVTRLPLYGGSNGNVWVEGRPPRQSQSEGPLVELASVAGDYFETLGIPLIRGRPLRLEDADSLAAGVVINETLAREAWPDANPIGKRFSYSDTPPKWLTVVGVVGDVRQWGPDRPTIGQAYVPLEHGWTRSGYLAVRTAADPRDLIDEIRHAVIAVDPTQPPTEVLTMDALVDSKLEQRRFYTSMLALFAGAALLLAGAGVYGTVSYFVARRTRELGIRVALGAPRTGIVGLVVRRGVRLSVWGMALGLIGVWIATAAIRGFVYGVRAVDPITLLAGCLWLALTAAMASALPALRAARVEPVLALRSE